MKSLFFTLCFVLVVLGGLTYYFKNSSPEIPEVLAEYTIPGKMIDEAYFANAPSLSKPNYGKFDYHFDVANALEINFISKANGKAQGNTNELIDSDIRGKFILSPVKYSTNSIYAIVDIRFNQIKSNLVDFTVPYELGMLKGNNGSLQPDQLKRKSIAVEVGLNGEIISMSTAEDGLSHETLAIAYDLLRQSLQKFPDSKQSGGGNVVIEERDERGTSFKMNYTIVHDSKISTAKGELVQPKKNNAALTILSANQSKMNNVEWNHAIGFPSLQKWQMSSDVSSDKDKIIDVIASHESTFVMSSNTHTEKELIEYPIPLDLAGFLYKKGTTMASSSRDGKQFNMESLTKDLKIMEKEKFPDQEKVALFRDMGKLAKQRPELTRQFVELARQFKPNSTQRDLIIGSLGYASNDYAHSALTEIYMDKTTTSREREKVLAELNLTSHPLNKSVKKFVTDVYLKAKDPEKRNMAALTLGSYIGNSGDKETIQMFKNEYEKSNADKFELLAVMGNSRSEEFLPEIKSAIKSGIIEDQVSGVKALRLYQTEEAREIMFSMTESKHPQEIRMKAFENLRYQPFDQESTQALSGCVESPDGALRSTCYGVLSMYVSQPEAKSILQEGLEKETDPSIKENINNALNSRVE